MSLQLDTTPRKQPRQQRAKVTVDAILDATAQVLTSLGYDRASTNRIAARAGVSVGTLYQYFPSKEALVAALAQRHCGQMNDMLARYMDELADAPIEVTVRAFVRAMLAVHAHDPQLHSVLTEQIPRLAGMAFVHELNQVSQQLVAAYLSERQSQLMVKNVEIASFVLVTAVEAVAHLAVLERPEDLQGDALCEELCALVLRYLGVQGAVVA